MPTGCSRSGANTSPSPRIRPRDRPSAMALISGGMRLLGKNEAKSRCPPPTGRRTRVAQLEESRLMATKRHQAEPGQPVTVRRVMATAVRSALRPMRPQHLSLDHPAKIGRSDRYFLNPRRTSLCARLSFRCRNPMRARNRQDLTATQNRSATTAVPYAVHDAVADRSISCKRISPRGP